MMLELFTFSPQCWTEQQIEPSYCYQQSQSGLIYYTQPNSWEPFLCGASDWAHQCGKWVPFLWLYYLTVVCWFGHFTNIYFTLYLYACWNNKTKAICPIFIKFGGELGHGQWKAMVPNYGLQQTNLYFNKCLSHLLLLQNSKLNVV